MSPNRNHSNTYKASEGQECKGIAVVSNNEGRETLKLIIDENDGITNTINEPNSVHIPDLSMVIVSPQHWTHQTSDGN